ncbi:glutamate-1-semialdehyde 2,1-aminomutase [Actinomyces vulturis]|uniref:glutamate-1-semialdehyde 2,1-aminomutase n=1 Tax=Actinomyces vulturis TaxID=1857645 RepID=UPI0008367037|nr:glutamate-1-semialdehyde 2,1-aminomutase [Actinomyces vulturis]
MTLTNDSLFHDAQVLIPGGVNSPVRAFASVGGTPLFIDHARGPRVWDVEGRDYVDLVGSWGPAIVGHAHPEVLNAVEHAARKGLSFGAPTEGEVRLAEMIRQRVPAAERVRCVSTGTEATMTAIRLARGATGRDLVVKFAGCYHGHSDGLLAAAGSGVATGGLPECAGVPASITANTIVLPFNDVTALEECFTERGSEIAAVITEPQPANMGVVEPVEGFNAEIRRITRSYGALMIADEVLSGFRVAPSGMWGLEAYDSPFTPVPTVSITEASWVPDLFTFGKVVGGGMPLAALGGRADVMDLLAPVGPVYQAGTLSGNPLATAAGAATLTLCDEGLYRHLDSVADQIIDVVSSALTAEGVGHWVGRAGSLFSFFFTPEGAPVHSYEQAQLAQTWRYPAFFHAFVDAGVNLPPSNFEAWFVSGAHGDEELERIAQAAPVAARAAASATLKQ